ncbi:MAG: glycoside hydrolase family 36 protein [Anaerolineales bacterium]
MPKITLANAAYELNLLPEAGSWSVHSRHFGEAHITGGRLGINCELGHTRINQLLTLSGFAAETPEMIDTPFGRAHLIELQVQQPVEHLAVKLRFRIPEDSPLLHWQVQITNQNRKPVHIHKIEMLRLGFVTVSQSRFGTRRSPTGSFNLAAKPGDLAFFANGWGSWNYSGAYQFHERFMRSRLGPFSNPMRVNAGTPQPRRRGHFASDFFGILGDVTHRVGLLAGFLAQQQHFGSLEAYTDPFKPALRLWANGDRARLDPGQSMSTDWACLGFLHLDTPDPLAPYLLAVAQQHGLPVEQLAEAEIPTGWCSWYYYFQDISPEIIQANIEAAKKLQPELPLKLIQIDDGYQAEVGDWLTFNEHFPDGPAPLAEAIRQNGFTPGIWLAPYIVHPKAQLIEKHPDWLLRNASGRPVNAGFVWNTFTRALDLTNPEAMEYTREVIAAAAQTWGFDYLKLDFLYAAALPGVYQDPTLTRAQVLRRGLATLRAAAGDQTTLLACGCPLGPALGLFEAMRIGSDVAPNWHPRLFNLEFLVKPEPDYPSARNAIHNTITRAAMHRRWWINDPDCLLVRPDSRLTLAEVRSLATAIAMSGGSLLLSDDLPNLPDERMRIAKALLPVLGKRPYVLDWFDSPTPTRLQIDLDGPVGGWHLLALFNWQDVPADLILNPDEFYLDSDQTYLAREFWRGEVHTLDAAGHTWQAVPPHSCLFFAVRPRHNQPIYAGSDLHASQGLEVVSWSWEGNAGTLELARPGLCSGSVDLFLPDPPRAAALDGQPLTWQAREPHIFRFPVEFKGTGRLEISL